MTSPVSVCIPAYKQPQVLLRTLKSVLMQKKCEFEVIITDDSSDDSVESALGNLLGDSRIRYFRNPTRLGAIGNWNASIENAQTDIIKILHHDDWFITEEGLALSTQSIASGETLVVFTACKAMSVEGGEIFSHCATAEQVGMLKKNPHELVFANFIGPPSVVAFSRKVLVPFNFKYTWVSDIDFYIRLIESAKGEFIYLNTHLINVTSDSTEQLSRECEDQRLRSLKENISLFAEYDVNKQHKKLAAHFLSLVYGLTAREIFDGIRFALQLSEVKIAGALSKGLLFSILSGK